MSARDDDQLLSERKERKRIKSEPRDLDNDVPPLPSVPSLLDISRSASAASLGASSEGSGRDNDLFSESVSRQTSRNGSRVSTW